MIDKIQRKYNKAVNLKKAQHDLNEEIKLINQKVSQLDHNCDVQQVAMYNTTEQQDPQLKQLLYYQGTNPEKAQEILQSKAF